MKAAIYFYIAFVVAMAYGWIANIFGILNMLDGPITAMFVARIVGVFAVPIGAVLGYF